MFRYVLFLYAQSLVMIFAQDATLQSVINQRNIAESTVECVVGSSNLIYFLSSNGRPKDKLEILATSIVDSVVEVDGGYYDQQLKKDFPDPKNDHMELKGTLSIIHCFKGKSPVGNNLPYLVALPLHMTLHGFDLPTTSLIDGGTALMAFNEVPSTTLEALPNKEFVLTKSFQKSLSEWDGQSQFTADSILSNCLSLSHGTSDGSLGALVSKYDLAPDVATVLVVALESPDTKLHSEAIDVMLNMCKQNDISAGKMNGLIYACHISIINNLISLDISTQIEQALSIALKDKNLECKKLTRALGMRALF